MAVRRPCLALLGLFGLAIAMPVAAQGPYVNHELKFGFTPPAGWVQKPGDMKMKLVVAFVEAATQPTTIRASKGESDEEFLRRIKAKLREPVDSGGSFQPNITVTCGDAGSVTLQEYARETRLKAQKTLHDQRAKGGTVIYQILTEKPRKLAGVPAIERVNAVITPDGQRVSTREVISIQQGRIYTVTLAAAQGTLPRYNPEFDRALASFVWKN